MNVGYSKGAISKMLVINILLAALIASAVFMLLARDDKTDTTTFAKSPDPTKITRKLEANSPTPANTQAEIDALKDQLQREASNLDTLREEDRQAEVVRTVSSTEAVKALVAQALESQGTPSEHDQKKVNETVSEAPE